MRAVYYDQFGVTPIVAELAEPDCPPDGALVAVAATGLCRSDWHGWTGHDPDVVLPHVPGHEFAGTVVEVGPQVRTVKVGQRVTTPFVNACGSCATCRTGNEQICENQHQPGFTDWGSFAELVVVHSADVNAVEIPQGMEFEVAAGLGCRFATAYRAVTVHARPRPGEWLAVHGCGGVGLAAVMIAVAAGARVLAVDPGSYARERAIALGAELTVNPADGDVSAAILAATAGGAAASIDAIGGAASALASVAGLARRGRHVQVGLLGADATLSADLLTLTVVRELQLFGSHGMPARAYPDMLARISSGELRPQELVARRIGLAEAGPALAALGAAQIDGITVIDPRLA